MLKYLREHGESDYIYMYIYIYMKVRDYILVWVRRVVDGGDE